MIVKNVANLFCSVLMVSSISSCTTISKPASALPVSDDLALEYKPSNFGSTETLTVLSVDELRELNLVATNLVSVLLQIPELEPINSTFQVTRPTSAFGNVLVRVMQDAGFALQLVNSDQGPQYVSYGKSFSVTDTGSVFVYSVAINDIEITRDFVNKSDGIFPASLVSIKGTNFINGIQVDDSIFTEQGGDDSFISGVRTEDSSSANISEVEVNDYDRLPLDKVRSRESVIADARRHYFLAHAHRTPPDLSEYDRYRRTVLIFEDKNSLHLGDGNKRSLRLLIRELDDTDVLLIRACNDVDGVNEVAQDRAIRVEEEFLSYQVPIDSVFLAPCAQTNYRHPSDDSPVPVEVVHYRPKDQ